MLPIGKGRAQQLGLTEGSAVCRVNESCGSSFVRSVLHIGQGEKGSGGRRLLPIN